MQVWGPGEQKGDGRTTGTGKVTPAPEAADAPATSPLSQAALSCRGAEEEPMFPDALPTGQLEGQGLINCTGTDVCLASQGGLVTWLPREVRFY